jgi:DNA-binding IclR family transcriptional regulator
VSDVPVARVKSADRALAILEALSESRRTFSELHATLHFPRSSLHGLLGTLVVRGWLQRDVHTRQFALADGIRVPEVQERGRSETCLPDADPAVSC